MVNTINQIDDEDKNDAFDVSFIACKKSVFSNDDVDLLNKLMKHYHYAVKTLFENNINNHDIKFIASNMKIEISNYMNLFCIDDANINRIIKYIDAKVKSEINNI